LPAQTAAANEQHYEVPTEYFLAVLGPHRKYSSCLYEKPDASLAEAEAAMLELCCQRAQLEDGQQVDGLGGTALLGLSRHSASPPATAGCEGASARLPCAVLRPAPPLLPAALPACRQVLELGCGWGSWSLFMAAKYPRSSITAVSNSRTQRAHITAEAE
jgi:cyclopropane fatty-acyl-phospholipid synthase-like methyltransferase